MIHSAARAMSPDANNTYALNFIGKMYVTKSSA